MKINDCFSQILKLIQMGGREAMFFQSTRVTFKFKKKKKNTQNTKQKDLGCPA